MSTRQQVISAVIVLIVATVVSLIPNSPSAPARDLPAATATVTATSAPQEDEPGWDCHQVTENSNGVCGDELPDGFDQCVQASGYDVCIAAVREHLGR